MTEMSGSSGLAISFLIMVLYAVAISTGWGRRIDDDVVTRWLIVVGGVLIVLVPNSWGDWAALREWLFAFGLNSFPLIARAAYLYHQECRLADIRRCGIPGTHQEVGTDAITAQTVAGSRGGGAY